MIKIRLQRRGSRNKPFYRIVASDEKKKMGGNALDILGYWQPSKKTLKLNKEKYSLWIKNGGVPTKAIKSLITSSAR